MKKQHRGAITVEAAIVLPFYILTIVFILNFMNLFYTQLAIQEGMNNAAGVVAQYTYAANIFTEMKNLSLEEETAEKVKEVSDKAKDVTEKVNAVAGSLNDLSGFFAGGIKVDQLMTMAEQGKALGESIKELGEAASNIGGDDMLDALLATGVEAGGSAAMSLIVDRYLDDMHINRSLIDGDIKVLFSYDASHNYDITMVALYSYKDPMISNLIGTVPMKQVVVVHPWIGGGTKGLRQK